MLFNTELLYLLKIKDKNKIMILTGKAKEDFLEWLNKEMYYLGRNNFEDRDNNIEDLSDNFQNALIIEWFDSVGIFVSINYVDFYNEIRNDKGFEAYVTKGISVKFRSVSSRQEATIQAIKKANEIYNTTL